LLASIAFPAWCLGHDPSAQILSVSYGQDLADKLARDCRSIMMSRWYRQIFSTRLAAHRQAVQEFITTRQGYRLATSTGGVLTGRGADIILIDDPLKPEEALSEAQRQAANEWYDHTLYSRQNDKQRGAIVIIMQRLHEDDLVGHVLAQEDWEVLSFPAIAEADEEEARQKRLEQEPETESHAMVRLLARVVGIGIETADMLVHEVLSRPDRKAVARYAGLTGSPDESGAKRREQGLARAGNARVRRGMIQLAWRFLLFQKESALTLWYRARTADSRISTRKTMIVALARKLVIALWRFVTTGEPLEGVVLRPAA